MDNWYNFWKNSPLAYSSGVNLRPDSYRVQSAVQHLDTIFHFNRQSVLDVGCGNGMVLAEIQKVGCQVTGVDYSSNMVKLASGIVHGSIHEADATQLPFSDNLFDIVFSLAMIQYLDKENAKKAIKEMYRVCKEGSLILLGDTLNAAVFAGADGMTAFALDDFKEYTYTVHRSYFEPERRFDILIQK